MLRCAYLSQQSAPFSRSPKTKDRFAVPPHHQRIIIHVVPLSTELPWGRAVVEEPAFLAWKNHEHTRKPFNRIDNLPLSLVRKILCVQIGKRIGIPQIKSHLWCRKKFKDSGESCRLFLMLKASFFVTVRCVFFCVPHSLVR